MARRKPISPQGRSCREVAELLGTTVDSIRRGVRLGRIPSFRIPATGRHGIIRIPGWWLLEKIGGDAR